MGNITEMKNYVIRLRRYRNESEKGKTEVLTEPVLSASEENIYTYY